MITDSHSLATEIVTIRSANSSGSKFPGILLYSFLTVSLHGGVAGLCFFVSTRLTCSFSLLDTFLGALEISLYFGIGLLVPTLGNYVYQASRGEPLALMGPWPLRVRELLDYRSQRFMLVVSMALFAAAQCVGYWLSVDDPGISSEDFAGRYAMTVEQWYWSAEEHVQFILFSFSIWMWASLWILTSLRSNVSGALTVCATFAILFVAINGVWFLSAQSFLEVYAF